jgi:hypothetical protein
MAPPCRQISPAATAALSRSKEGLDLASPDMAREKRAALTAQRDGVAASSKLGKAVVPPLIHVLPESPDVEGEE